MGDSAIDKAKLAFLTTLDRMFEDGLKFAIFDKRVLLPLAQLPDAVARATGERVSEEELRMRAGQGWFPLLPGAGEDGDEEGVPLYVPGRIGWLYTLQRRGYSTDELRLISQHEEGIIDECLTVDHMAYSDDDLETLLLHDRANLYSAEHERVMGPSGEVIDQAPQAEKLRKEIRVLEHMQSNGIPEAKRDRIARLAFRARWLSEFIRVDMVQTDRTKALAGYSPFVQCSSSSWSQSDGFKGGPIHWELTVQAAATYGTTSEIAPIRVPDFLLRGDQVIPTRTLRPTEYAQLWKERNLDTYLEWVSELLGERRCLNCFAALPTTAGEHKRFCGERCRNAAKQRRYRERNPEAVQRAQQRYWQSLDG